MSNVNPNMQGYKLMQDGDEIQRILNDEPTVSQRLEEHCSTTADENQNGHVWATNAASVPTSIVKKFIPNGKGVDDAIPAGVDENAYVSTRKGVIGFVSNVCDWIIQGINKKINEHLSVNAGENINGHVKIATQVPFDGVPTYSGVTVVPDITAVAEAVQSLDSTMQGTNTINPALGNTTKYDNGTDAKSIADGLEFLADIENDGGYELPPVKSVESEEAVIGDITINDDGIDLDTFDMFLDTTKYSGYSTLAQVTEALKNTSGTKWYNGTAMSGTETTTNMYYYSDCPIVKLGDYYLNTAYGYVYECTIAGSGTAAKWTYRMTIKGTQDGDSTGQRGSKWFTGTAISGTSTTTGAYTWNDSEQKYVGDMYLNTTYGYVYKCTTAGTYTTAKWTYQGSIKGTNGTNGTNGKDAADYVVTTVSELKNAISSLSNAGGKIILKAGTYNLDQYTITKNIIFEGMGDCVTLQHDGAWNASTSVDLKFHNMKVSLENSAGSTSDRANLYFDSCVITGDTAFSYQGCGNIYHGYGNVYINNSTVAFEVNYNAGKCSQGIHGSGGKYEIYNSKMIVGNRYSDAAPFFYGIGEFSVSGCYIDIGASGSMPSYLIGSETETVKISNNTIRCRANGEISQYCSSYGDRLFEQNVVHFDYRYDMTGYLPFPIINGNIFEGWGDGSLNIRLKTSSVMTNNHFINSDAVYIDGDGRKQIITLNCCDGTLSTSHCAAGSITTNNLNS